MGKIKRGFVVICDLLMGEKRKEVPGRIIRLKSWTGFNAFMLYLIH